MFNDFLTIICIELEKCLIKTLCSVDQAWTYYLFLSTQLKRNKECCFRNDAPPCNLRARDPHQLLLNTSHFLPLSLEKLLSYAGARLLIQLPRKSEILAPNFLRVDALRCFEIGSRAKKTVHTYIPLPCAMYLCCNIYVPTYLSFDSLHNEAKSCLKLDFMRYFSTFNTLRKSKKIVTYDFFKSLQKWFEPIVVRFRRKQGMLQAFFHKKINTFLFVPVGNGLVYVREGHRTWYIVQIFILQFQFRPD